MFWYPDKTLSLMFDVVHDQWKWHINSNKMQNFYFPKPEKWLRYFQWKQIRPSLPNVQTFPLKPEAHFKHITVLFQSMVERSADHKKTVVKQPKQHLHWGFLAPEEHHTEGGKTCCLGQLKGPFCHASTGHEHHDVTDPEFVWAFHPARYLCHYLCLTMA